jgi:subtilisin family serine protease
MRDGARLLGLVPLVAALAGAAPAAAADRSIVGFERGVDAGRFAQIVERAGGRVTKRLDGIRAAAVRPRGGRSANALRAALGRRGGVRYAEPDFTLRKSETPDDPLLFRQYALGTGGGAISAPPAWDSRTGCSKVAVLDSGVQHSHPDLQANVWHNSGEINDNGKDDDRNGYVDDYYGVNVRKGSGSGGDADGHGTHVAGIVGGRGNNDVGVSGLCWSAKLMPVRFMDDNGRGSTSDAIAGLDYAVDQGAKIVNCSFGSSAKSTALHDAIDDAQDRGVLLVVAAGNDGDSLESHPEYPASYKDGNIVTVAATTSTDALADFSNFGATSVDLAAPGDGIYSTYPTSTYRYLDGTSMASPYVAGAAAMLRSANPDLSYSQIRSALLDSIDELPGLQGKTATGGRLNLDRALERAG